MKSSSRIFILRHPFLFSCAIIVAGIACSIADSCAKHPHGLLFAITAQESAGQNQNKTAVSVLELGKPSEHEISGKEQHAYQVALRDSQYAGIVVEQLGIDVTVQIRDASDKLVAEFDSEPRLKGQEQIGVVGDTTADYRVSVRPKYPKVPAGKYEIRLTEVRVATERDRFLFEAHKLSTRSQTLYDAGKYDDAIATGESAVDSAQKALGSDDPYIAYLLTQVALAQRPKGDIAKAQPNVERAIAIEEKTLGKEDPQTAWSYNVLGLAYRSKNEDARAEQYSQQAIDIVEKSLGPEHPRIASYLLNLATLHEQHRDSDGAIKELQRALAIVHKTLEDDSFLELQLTHNLGDTYLNQDDLERAKPLTERSLELAERRFGPDHPNIVFPLRNLGSIARMKKQYPLALQYFSRAQKIQEKTFGPAQPARSGLLINIGNVYYEQGDYPKALGLFQRSYDVLEDADGPYSDLALMALNNITNTYSAQGDVLHAVDYGDQVSQVVEKKIELNLAIGSERQRLAYSEWMADRTDRTITLHAQLFPGDPRARDLAALAILRRKGRVLDAMSNSMAGLRQHLQPDDQKLLDQLTSTNSELAKVALGGPGKTPIDEYTKRLSALEGQRDRIEAEISRSSAGYYAPTSSLTLDAIEAAIPNSAVLIEFAEYRPYDPKATEQGYGNPRYIAYVISAKDEVRWKDLGSADDIDKAIESLRAALLNPHRTDARQLSHALDAMVMQPLRALLGNASQLLISPDGELNLIPFEALMDEHGHYLVQRYSISYLTTGRDLLRLQAARASKSKPLIVADPAFGEPQTGQVASVQPAAVDATSHQERRRSITTASDLSSVYFAPLSATALEARNIKSLFPDSTVLTGSAATKLALTQIDAPSMLHIATHGFFLVDSSSTVSGPAAKDSRAIHANVKVENPLLRSGLALAGANLSNSKDNGVLTALEASNLNLWGTKLVTLSACDTGVGEVKTGEGVYGLRRAFFLAGSETLVMSLWPVSDYSTREMMTAYYGGLKKGLGRGEALRQAELSMLRRKGRSHPFYWASFIQSGEWANLNGQR